MIKGKWKVTISKKAYKELPKKILPLLGRLLEDLGSGPQMPNWPNYSKLGHISFHCHIKKGHPTYVACWVADKNKKIIEVYYVGTHEKAPY